LKLSDSIHGLRLTTALVSSEKNRFLQELGIEEINPGSCAGPDDWGNTKNRELMDVVSPIDASVVARVALASEEDYDHVVEATRQAFLEWRLLPAPKRGLIVRDVGEELRRLKEPLGKLVTLEMGKILPEGLGEIQEAIDISDFAVGLSRQLYGMTMQSERSGHRMYEQWHPLGVVGIITAFNFPVAVWSWNSMVAAVCGDTMVWKPSSKTPLCAIAMQNILNRVMERHDLRGVFGLVIGRGSSVGERMLNDKRIALISATGSTGMGRRVAEATSRRLAGRILELGGNNAIIVAEDADLDLAVRAIVFGAVGTAGQRCTTTRRIIAQNDIFDELTSRLISAYKQIKIGDPFDPATLMGPIVDVDAQNTMMKASIGCLTKEGRSSTAEKCLTGRDFT